MAEQVEKKTPEKAKPAKKKGGFLKKASRFFKDLKSEVKKVVWPTRKQVFLPLWVPLESLSGY